MSGWVYKLDSLRWIIAHFSCLLIFFKSVEQKGCKSEQSDGIIWNTTLAGTTKKEPCPENQIGITVWLSSL